MEGKRNRIVDRISSILCICVLVSGLPFWVSCHTENHEYVVERSFEGECWALDDPVVGTFPPDDTLWLGLEFTEAYDYQNIHLKLHIFQKEGVSWEDTLLNIPLMDNMGNWYGRPIRDKIFFQIPHPSPPIELSSSSLPFEVHLTQYMREESLCGVQKVGILSP